MMFIMLMQIASDILNENTTSKGILIAIILALCGVVIKLYSEKNSLEAELRTLLKEFSDKNVKSNQQYNDFVDAMEKYTRDVQR